VQWENINECNPYVSTLSLSLALLFVCKYKNVFFGRWKKSNLSEYFFRFKNNISFLSIEYLFMCRVEREELNEKKLLLNSELLLEKYFPISRSEVKWLHVWWNDWSWLSWNIFLFKIFFTHMQKENEKRISSAVNR
jgi:hypothetical protein